MNRAAQIASALAIALLLGSGPTSAEDAPAAPVAAPAEPAPAGGQQKYTAAELETLVGPIALYPDMVLAAMLPATAAALDVVQAARYVESKGGKVDAVPDDVTWDPAVVSLLQFPDVLKWMNENLEWVEQMAFAVSVQQSDVLAAIQTFRKKTQEAGNLKSDQYMKVATEEAPLPPGETVEEGVSTEVIVIEPTDPEVVYIPTYEPAAVVTPYYGAYPATPLYGWGVGFAMGVAGAWIGHELGWWGGGHGGDINIDNDWNRNTNIDRGDRPDRGDRGDRGGGRHGPDRPQQWKPNKPAQRPGGGVRGPSKPISGAGGVRPAPGGGQGLKPPSRPPSAATRPGGGAGGRPSGGARPSPAPSIGGSRPSASTRPAGGGAFGGSSGTRSGAANSSNRGGQSLGASGRSSASSRPSSSSRPSGGAQRSSSAPRSGGGYSGGSFGGSNRSGSATRGASSRGRSSAGGGRGGGGRGGGGRGGGGRRR